MHELLFSILNLFVLYPVSCCRYFMCVVSKVVRAYVSDSLGLHVISFRRRKKIKKIKKLYLVTAGFFILFVTRPLLAEAAVTSDKGKQGSEGSLKDDLAYIKDWISRDKQLVIPAKAAKPVRKTVKKAPIIAEQPIVQTKPISYSQSQKAMLGSLPELQSDSDENAGAAFNGLVKESMPLTPRQVVKLRQLIDQSQRAAVIPPTIPPKPISSTVMINLAPGATPPAIRLAQGYVTSLVFVDSAGSPWPVASYDIGNIKSTSIQWDGKGNILLVQAATPYGDSDIVIRLKGLATPVTLELVSGQRVVDYRT